MNKALRAIGSLPVFKLRHTQLGPTCDTQSCCQFRSVLWLLIVCIFYLLVLKDQTAGEVQEISNFKQFYLHCIGMPVKNALEKAERLNQQHVS
jgi:hypothetical protein